MADTPTPGEDDPTRPPAKAPPPAVGPTAPQPTAQGRLAPGALLAGRYRIDGLIGRGGFAETYRATDLALPVARPCVVKRILLGDDLTAEQQAPITASLANEAALLSSLNTPGHENIPEIYDYLPDQLSLVIKFVEGESLWSLIKRRGEPLDPVDALRYAHDVCSAVVYLHERGVLHHDIKPDNLLVDSRGRVWLIDFGIGAFGQPDPAGGTPRGSPIALSAGYAPQEQWSGTSEPRTDVYALAATLYALLTGQRPPLQGPPEPLGALRPEVGPELEGLIARATAPRAEDRPTAAELLAELTWLCNGLGIEPPAPIPDLGGLIGREEERQRYTRSLEAAGRAVISGMAGLGKTALAADLARRAQAPSRRFWHRVHAGEGAGTTMRKLAEFLAWGGSRALWELRYARGVSPATALDPHEEIDLLSGLLRGRDALICLDDAHHLAGDPLGAALLARLAELAGQGHIRLIVTSREPIPAVSAEPALPPLRPADADDLIGHLGLGDLAAELRGRLVARLGGNAQCLRLAAGLLAGSPHMPALIAALPETPQVAGYLMDQIYSRLSDDERAVMEALAILGDRGGSRAAVEALLDRGAARRVAVAPALLRLQARDLLVASVGPGGVEYYQHAIVQGFCYGLLNIARRAQLHRRAAAHYALPSGHPLRAAHHAALAGDARRALGYAVAYTPAAPSRGDAGELLALLDSLAAQRLGRADLIAVALARGDLGALLRRPEPSRLAYQEALAALGRAPRSAEQRALLAHACLGMATVLEHTSTEEALGWARRGLEAAAEQPVLAARLERRRGSVLFLAGEEQEAQAALEAALRLAAPEDLLTRGDAALDLGNLACMGGDFAAGRALFNSALASYERAGDTWRMLPVMQNLAQVSEISGEWGRAGAEYERVQALAERLGRVETSAQVQLARGVLLLNQGQFDPAHATLAAACDYARAYALDEALMGGLTSFADLALRLGDTEAARARLREAGAVAGRSGIVTQLAEIGALEAELALAEGAPAQALVVARAAVKLARDQSAALEHGKALRTAGRAAAASGDLTGALGAFAEALALLDSDPYELARTLLAQAAALAPGSAERALAAREARDIFARLSAAHDLAIAETLLAATA